ncbi:hypothetical protein N0V90_000660 [Kalmusia sp. IMI 367209]|nr:hypothetical protein N0V90_000660 [Kalmusia sp. IMI 367209]
MEQIAIIGHSYRLPQDTNDDATFWDLLENGRNVMSEWPASRTSIDSFHSTEAQRDNLLTSRGAHFLNRDPSIFDAPFFSITSKEAASMDPQQRWLLESSYHAFENAGIPIEKLAGSPTSVFAASMTDDYNRIVSKDPDITPTNAATGNNPSILANRLSWYFNLRGPSIALNTACSTGMVAMDLACQSLRSGQSSMALVGGTSALLSIETSMFLHSMNFLSRDSLSYSFDARANGYSRGEGVVVLLLKRLPDAIRDGDNIRAVIRGTGTNQDGHTPGITQPNASMQEELVRALYKRVGLDLAMTRYVEAHGTGTMVGDPAEANALGRVFRSYRSESEPLFVRLSINSFGFGGTNGHMILDDAYHTLENLALKGIHHTIANPPTVRGSTDADTVQESISNLSGDSSPYILVDEGVETPTSASQPQILVLSAKDEAAATRMVRDYSTYYTNHIAGRPRRRRQMAHILASRRSLMSWRSIGIAGLDHGFPLSFTPPTRANRDIGLVLVFTGQGVQYANMGLPIAVFSGLFKDVREGHNWNLTPIAVMGHSSGEIAAAYAVGALSLESACAVAYHRGRLAEQLAASRTGAMISVNLSEHAVPEYVRKVGIEGEMHIACVNSPGNCTLSADAGDIDRLKTALDEGGIFGQKLNTGVAYHSPAMQDIAQEYLVSIGKLISGPRKNTATMISSVTASPVQVSSLLQPQYWVDNLVSTVRFSDALQYLVAVAPKQDNRLNDFDFLEIGPHGALRRAIADTISELGKKPRYMSMLSKLDPSLQTPMKVVGSLLARGHAIDIEKVNQSDVDGPYSRALTDLPAYPFDNSLRYWYESRLSSEFSFRGPAPRDVLGFRAADWNPLEPRWRKMISVDEMPWVADHMVGDMIIYPGAGTMLMALEAARQMAKQGHAIKGFLFKEATFLNPVVVKPEGQTEVMTQLRPLQYAYEKTSTRSEVRVFALQEGAWRECLKATVHVEYDDGRPDEIDGGREHQALTEMYYQQWEVAKEECTKKIDKEDFYRCTETPSQMIEDVSWDENEVAVSRVPAEIEFQGLVHPIILDAICQTGYAAPSKGATATLPTLIPYKVSDAWVSSSGWQQAHNSSIRVRTVAKPKVGVAGQDVELVALANDGSLLAHFADLEMRPVLDNSNDSTKERNLLYSIEWHPQLDILKPKDIQIICARAHKNLEEQEDRAKEIAQLRDATLRAMWLECQLSGDFPEEELALTPEDIALHSARVLEAMPGWKVFFEVAKHLTDIVRGDVDPLDLLFSGSLASDVYETIFSQICDVRFSKYVTLLSHQKSSLKILEVGAGTGGWTTYILSALHEREMKTGGMAYSEYTYTDISPSFFDKAKEKLSRLGFGERVKFQTFNLENEIAAEGFQDRSFDVIFAGSVLHATSNLSRTLSNLHRLLKPSGRLIFHEPTRPEVFAMGLGFGVLSGWWLGEEDFRASGPTITESQWEELLKSNGYSGVDMVTRDWENEKAHIFSLMMTTALSTTTITSSTYETNVTIVLDLHNADQMRLSSSLSNTFRKTDIISTSDLGDESKTFSEYVLFLADIGESVLRRMGQAEFVAFKKAIRRWKNILWVTASSPYSQAPHEGLKDGFLRALRAETPEKRIVSLSLDSLEGAESHINRVFKAAFSGESIESEYAIRDDQIMMPRLVSEVNLNASINSSIHLQPSLASWKSGPPLRLDVLQRGSLETIYYAEDTGYYKSLDPKDVEIDAKAWGLSFRDVFSALGRLEEDVFGTDASGVVTRVGKDVTNVKPGDRVCMAVRGAMRMFPRSPQWYGKIPHNLTFEQGAALLNPGLTALYSLIEVARLGKEDKILIHAASGGTGQLAIQVAQMVGAEIFATVGYDEKRQLVRELGVPEDHIFYSRNTSFKQGILRVTKGYGVDVVFNSLSGEGLRASWECLAPCGRFIEIGKADIMSNEELPMGRFDENRSFIAIDIRHISMVRPGLGERVLENLLKLAEEGVLRPPTPLHVYSVEKTEDAFRYFQSGRNTGRIVISMEDEAIVPKRVLHRKPWIFDENASYLVVGGLGGIGRGIMKWMASRGAKHLIALSRFSRSAKASQAATEVIEQLRQQGINVATPRCDAASRTSLREVLEGCANTMPPIRGCINAAMVLQDSTFENMTHFQWTTTLDSKVATSWNLHTELPKDLDFFILLASVAGIIGSPGQSNYASGCTFQDALARHRVKGGHNALSIDLGVMRTIGLVAETGRLQKSYDEGEGSIKIEESEFFALLDTYCDPGMSRIVDPDKSQIGMGIVTPADLLLHGTEIPELLDRPLYANFAQPRNSVLLSASSSNPSINFVVLFSQASTEDDRAHVVVQALSHKLSRALSMKPEDVDAEKPLHVFGVDSLVAVELRNWLRKEFAAEVAVFDIMGAPSVMAIGGLVAKIIPSDPPIMPDPRDCLMEEDLETAWHFQREATFRNNLKIIWSTVDSYLTVLDASIVPTRRPLRDMLNKPTAFYFEQSAQYGRHDDVHGYPRIQRIYIAAIYEAWRARCGDRLDIEFGHFLANPVRITKQGPRNLGEIAAAHQTMCNMAKMSVLETEKYEILASYPAVVLICDRKVKESATDDDGLVNLRRVAEQLTVLVMRTDASLENQVTLDDLEPHALPLERSDAHGIDVRRVPLAIAVDFIVNLEEHTREPRKRTTHEYDSGLCHHVIPKGFDRTVKNDPQMWAAALMASDMSKGPDRLKDIQEAIQRIEARASGAPYHFDFEHEEWSRHWKSGYGEGPRDLSNR